MKKFKITSIFKTNKIKFETVIKCTLFKKNINDIELVKFNNSNLNFQYKTLILNEIMKILSDNNDGLKINNIPTSLIYCRILQLNDSYFVLIGNDFYKLKLKIKINVISDPFELITVN